MTGKSIETVPPEAFGLSSIVRIRDLEAVVRNFRLFRARAAATGAECAVVLKGDAHGAGMLEVAPLLYAEGARYFFVEECMEGIALRQALPHSDASIFAMAGLLHGEEVAFGRHNLIPCLNSIDQIRCWSHYCKSNAQKEAAIHLDSGMNRLGLSPRDAEYLAENFASLTAGMHISLYLSHLYDIKSDSFGTSFKQLQLLRTMLNRLPKVPVSLSCTDGVTLLPNDRFNLDMIRPGIGLLGGSPNARSFLPGIEPAIAMYAKLSQVRWVAKGSSIGYGGAFVTTRDTRIALAHIGYKDGYIRALSARTASSKGGWMCVAQTVAPVVGNISLGVTTLDVTDVPDEALSSFAYAEVIGPNVDVRELADFSGCYEILAALGRQNTKVADYSLQEFQRRFLS